VTDATIILDNVPRPNAFLLSVTGITKSFRLTGFTFRKGSVTTLTFNGAIRFSGTSPSLRMDHCHFDRLYNLGMQTYGQLYGVVDHCVFDSINAASVIVWHNTWGGKTHGDGSWHEPPYWGSEKFLFFEDNTFKNLNTMPRGAFDAKNGARFVIRHNYMYNMTVHCHGTEGDRDRGGRAIEIYNNTWYNTFIANPGQIRSGTLLIHDNTWTGKQLGGGHTLQQYRGFVPFQPWGGANGNNVWDVNDPHGLYASGTASRGSGTTCVDSTKNWATNQWKGYEFTNTSTGKNAVIESNTSNTLTYSQVSDWGGPWVTNAGNGYKIYKPMIGLDQPGRGAGDLLTGETPINSTTGTATWPHNALEPCYSWNNKCNGVNVNLRGGATPWIHEGRDYYNNTPMPGYTPYTYPHPLVSNLAPPSNLTIVP
jgi:hypothetical protein